MKTTNSDFPDERNLRRHRAVAIVVFVLVALGWSASVAAAGESCPCHIVRPQDDMWVISTRHLGACPDIKSVCPSSLHYFRFDDCRQQWVPATAAEFWQSYDPSMLVSMYVHGNRIKASLACERGIKMYRNLCLGPCCQRRIRHVIWSWPSDIIPGIVKDARVKARRTPPQSHLMAKWLSRFPPSGQVRITGLSYGARAICGALHLLGGGQLSGAALPCCYRGHVPRIRTIFWAPAMPRDWLRHGNVNGQALCAVEHMCVFHNRRDPALRFYKQMIGDGQGRGLGYAGVRWPQRLGPHADRYHQINVSPEVGVHHSWASYAESALLMCKTRTLMLR